MSGGDVGKFDSVVSKRRGLILFVVISTMEGIGDCPGDLPTNSAISFSGKLVFDFAGGFVGDFAGALGGVLWGSGDWLYGRFRW